MFLDLLRKATKPVAKTLLAGLAVATLATAAMAANPSDWPTKVNVGIIPTESQAALQTRFKPLREYLEKTLGVPVEIQSASDYAAVVEAMRFKKLEIAYFGPKSYVDAHARSNAQAVVVDKALDGTTGYNGIIISKRGSGIDKLSEIKGKTFAFTDPNSTSGYLVPMVYILDELNTRPEKYFSKVAFSGSHEASMLSVKNGTIDVAATNDMDFYRAAGEGKVKESDFNILWTSKMIVGSPWAVRGDLPKSFQNAFEKAMTSFKDKEYLTSLGLLGWVSIEDSAYDSIRKIMEVAAKLKENK